METDQNEPDETGQQHLDESENISEERCVLAKSENVVFLEIIAYNCLNLTHIKQRIY